MPRSPTAWPSDSFRIVLSVIVGFGAVAVVLGAAIGAVAFAIATGALTIAGLQHSPPIIGTDFALWSQYAAYVPVSAYILLVLRPLSKQTFYALGFGVPNGRDLAVASGGALAMWIGVSLASAILNAVVHRHDVEPAIDLLKHISTPAQKTSFILMAVAVAPLVEELLFRVFLFNAFRRWTPFWVAATASGLIFGCAHAQTASGMLTLGVPLAVGGIVLAGVYERTRNYWSSVITHALFNSVSVIAVFVFGAKP